MSNGAEEQISDSEVAELIAAVERDFQMQIGEIESFAERQPMTQTRLVDFQI
jgi:hypothetical protein